jgi:hypothetical protein
MPGFKYGLLVLPSREGLTAPLRMDDSTELVPTTLDALIDKKQTKHWREWVGSIEWKQLTEADALVITRIPSDTPEVMDGESQKLQGRAVTSWFAYLLAEPHPFTRGRGWILSGPCESGSRGGRLLDVKVLSREELTSPFYSELNEFWDSRGEGNPTRALRPRVHLEAGRAFDRRADRVLQDIRGAPRLRHRRGVRG